MTSPAQPLSFDCIGNDLGYCQTLKKSELPTYQFPAYCEEELTQGLIPLECESISIIESFSETFTTVVGFLVSQDRITPEGLEPHTATAPGYFEAGKSYLVTVQVANNTNGGFKVRVGDSLSPLLSNGVYSAILNTGSGTDLEIQGFDFFTALDGTIASISVQCIRYSELYTITGDYTFGSPTSIIKAAGTALTITRPIPTLQAGKTYRISFKISDNTCNAIPTEFAYCLGCSGPTYAQQINNGVFELDLVAQADPGKELYLAFPSCMDGRVDDITLYEQNEIRMGVYTKDKEPVDGPTVDIDRVEDKYLANIVEAQEGCVRLGYADLCSDYYGQFTGRNIIDLAQQRDLVNIVDDLNTFLMETANTGYAIYRNFLKPGISYQLSIPITSLTDDADDITVTVTAGGTVMTLTGVDPAGAPPYIAGTPYTFSFEGIAGEDNKDLIIEVSVTSASLFAEVGLNELDLHVNQGFPQFIPELFSECLNITENVDECEFIEIRYKNNTPVFGLEFDIANSQAFYDDAKMWIQAKLWHPNFKSDREVYMNTMGRRNINYSDNTKTIRLTTGLIPEYLLQALILARDCDTFLINDETYVCTSEEVEPQWDKSFTLASIELDFVKQDTRLLKTFA